LNDVIRDQKLGSISPLVSPQDLDGKLLSRSRHQATWSSMLSISNCHRGTASRGVL
jgi:hypothetical protein